MCRQKCRPFTGAWIETRGHVFPQQLVEVAPSRGRGLKQVYDSGLNKLVPSRPFTGAWIETGYGHEEESWLVRRPFTGAWIETDEDAERPFVDAVAPSRGRGLKRDKPRTLHLHHPSPLHGGVD